MTIETQPFEDVSPIKNGDFPASHVSFQGCNDPCYTLECETPTSRSDHKEHDISKRLEDTNLKPLPLSSWVGAQVVPLFFGREKTNEQ